jgi:hypothetical protein
VTISNNKYYVYAHITLTSNEIFYVGKGMGKRCYNVKRRSKYWDRIVNKYGYDIIILEDNLTNEESLLKEVY